MLIIIISVRVLRDIDSLADSTYTFDFLTGQRSQVKYTKAKIIDMYGFNKSLLAKKVD